MPTVAHIRARSLVGKLEEEIRADRMYEKVLQWVRLNYAPDLPDKTGTVEPLPPISEAAMKHAGGMEVFLSLEPDTLSIAKHRFCEFYKEAYRTFLEHGGKNRDDAKRILEGIRTKQIADSFSLEKTN